MSKGFSGASSDRMEVAAMMLAISMIPKWAYRHCEIQIISDSRYVVDTVETWLDQWATVGSIEDRANSDLWLEIHRLKQGISRLRVLWVKGHSVNEGNQIADALARASYGRMKQLSLVNECSVESIYETPKLTLSELEKFM